MSDKVGKKGPQHITEGTVLPTTGVKTSMPPVRPPKHAQAPVVKPMSSKPVNDSKKT
jgi:hypothetical protein